MIKRTSVLDKVVNKQMKSPWSVYVHPFVFRDFKKKRKRQTKNSIDLVETAGNFNHSVTQGSKQNCNPCEVREFPHTIYIQLSLFPHILWRLSIKIIKIREKEGKKRNPRKKKNTLVRFHPSRSRVKKNDRVAVEICVTGRDLPICTPFRQTERQVLSRDSSQFVSFP